MNFIKNEKARSADETALGHKNRVDWGKTPIEPKQTMEEAGQT